MQIKPSKTTIFLLTAGCFLSFFVFGFTDNLKGPTLPAMLAELNFSYGTGGNIFFGEYLYLLNKWWEEQGIIEYSRNKDKRVN